MSSIWFWGTFVYCRQKGHMFYVLCDQSKCWYLGTGQWKLMGHWNFLGDLMKQFTILLSPLMWRCHKNNLLIKCNRNTVHPHRAVAGCGEFTFLAVCCPQPAMLVLWNAAPPQHFQSYDLCSCVYPRDREQKQSNQKTFSSRKAVEHPGKATGLRREMD